MTCSRRSTNVAFPNGQPVRPCSRKSRSSSSRMALFKKPRQSATIASIGATRTSRSSRPDKCDLALLQGQSAASATKPARTGLSSTYRAAASKIRFVHDERGKPPLPEIPAPFFAEVDSPRIAPMGLADGPPQAVLRLRGPQSNERGWASGSTPIPPRLAPRTTRPSAPGTPRSRRRKRTSVAGGCPVALRDAASRARPISQAEACPDLSQSYPKCQNRVVSPDSAGLASSHLIWVRSEPSAERPVVSGTVGTRIKGTGAYTGRIGKDDDVQIVPNYSVYAPVPFIHPFSSSYGSFSPPRFPHRATTSPTTIPISAHSIRTAKKKPGPRPAQ